MSKIKELIRELCPEGVPIQRLGHLEDTGVIKLGRGKIISKIDIASNPGNFPVYSSSATNDGEIGRYGKYMFSDERITWSIDGGGKFFHRANHQYSVTNVGGWIKVLKEDYLSCRYLFFALTQVWLSRRYDYVTKAHPSVIREDYYVAIPPIEIQKEIVSILDNFTKLENELEAELKARRSQYEHYLEELFESPDHLAVALPLGDCGDFIRGKGMLKKTLRTSGEPAIHYGQLHTHYGNVAHETMSFVDASYAAQLRSAKPGNLVIATTAEDNEGVAKATAWVGESDAAVSGDAYIFDHHLDPLYVSYFFKSRSFQTQKMPRITGTKVKRISGEALAKIKIPVPDMATQIEIGKTLRKFDLLLNDSPLGLPAEIEARRRQYEHYRDKLIANLKATA